MNALLKLAPLLVSLAPVLLRVCNLFLDKVEGDAALNSEWQRFRERVFYKYSVSANAAKDASEIEKHLEEAINHQV